MRRYITYVTQALRSLLRRRVYIIVNGVFKKGKEDGSSEEGQKKAITVVSDFKYTPYA
jgi:hypothetical protein